MVVKVFSVVVCALLCDFKTNCGGFVGHYQVVPVVFWIVI